MKNFNSSRFAIQSVVKNCVKDPPNQMKKM